MPKRFEKVWESYLKAMPKDMPADQIREMKRAFFAGGWGCYTEIMFMVDAGREATPADETKLVDLHIELMEFCEAVKQGRG